MTSKVRTAVANVAAARRIRTTYTAMAAGALPVALLLLGGCNRQHNADVVATVNGHAIMRSEMDAVYRQQLGDAQNQPTSPEQSDQLKLAAVQELIEREIVEQQAAKMNLTATTEEVDAKISEMKAPYTDAQFNAKLKDSGQTMDDLRRNVRRGLTIDKLINKEINSKISVSDEDVTNYYNQHKSDFNVIEPRYRIAEIRVTDVPLQQPVNLQGSKATTDAEAKKKIQALKNRVDAGEDFGTLAMNYSEDPETSQNGGDMGWHYESEMRSDPTVFAAITKLKAGQTTDILPLLDGQTKKPVGYAIYKLISREPAGQRELSDPAVQQAIRQQLHDGRSQLLKAAYLETLRDQAKVENFFAEEILKNGIK